MLGYRFDTFEGFLEADFAAFQEAKWSSNRFNIERMKVRAKMDALGRAVCDHLPAGTIPEGLTTQTTLDHPHIFNSHMVKYCWNYFDRPPDLRDAVGKALDRDRSLQEKVGDPAPLHHSAFVGLGIWEDRVEAFFRMHAHALLDRRNLIARLADPLETKPAEAMLMNLFQTVSIRCGDDAPLTMSEGVAPSHLLEKSLGSLAGWFAAALVIPRGEALSAGADLVPRLVQPLPLLLRFWEFGAWSRSNDRLKLAIELKKERKEQGRRMAGLVEGDTVLVTSGLLAGKEGTVLSVDARGRTRVSVGRLSIDIDSKLLKKTSKG